MSYFDLTDFPCVPDPRVGGEGRGVFGDCSMFEVLYTLHGQRFAARFNRAEFAEHFMRQLPRPTDATLWHGATRRI